MSQPKSISYVDAVQYAELLLWAYPANGMFLAWYNECAMRRATWSMMLKLYNGADGVIMEMTR